MSRDRLAHEVGEGRATLALANRLGQSFSSNVWRLDDF